MSWRYNNRAYRAHRQNLVESVLALYNSNTSKEKLKEIFSKSVESNVVFVDPFVTVSGNLDYSTQFLALHQVFKSFRILSYELSGTYDKIILECIVEYESFIPYIKIHVPQITLIHISNEGLGGIIRHEDIWSITDIIQAIPVLGHTYTFFKKCIGTYSSKLWRFIIRLTKHKKRSENNGITADILAEAIEFEREGQENVRRKNNSNYLNTNMNEAKNATQSLLSSSMENDKDDVDDATFIDDLSTPASARRTLNNVDDSHSSSIEENLSAHGSSNPSPRDKGQASLSNSWMVLNDEEKSRAENKAR